MKQKSRACAAEPSPGPAPARRHKKRPPPWTRPVWCVWLVIAVLLSAWLTVNMPAPQKSHTRAPARELALSGQDQVRPSVSADITVSQGASSMAKRKMERENLPDDAFTRLSHRARMFVGLFLFVGLGAMLGAMIEGRRWYRLLSSTLGRLTRAARMPDIVGASLPTALASCPAADSMLVASHSRGELSSSTLIAAGMLNSFLAHLSHTMRIFYPVVAAIGLPGLMYFVVQFGGMAIFLALVLLWHRLRTAAVQTGESSAAQDPDFGVTAGPLPWKETLRRGLVRAASLLFKLACVSMPMILIMEWAINAGVLNFWEQIVPETVSRLFPEQLLTIMAAQIGGLIQSATLCAGFQAQGLITGPQILLAMLIASVVTNPARTVRRNLPTALAIFPPRTACAIVLGMQAARLCVTLLAAILLLIWMHASLA